MNRLRSKRLVNRNVQVGLVGTFLTIAVMSAVLQLVLVHRSSGKLADRLAEPEVLLGSLPDLLMGNLLITLGTLLPSMWFLGMLITHRIAGPLYRFERYFEEVARKGYQGPCVIRESDELQELCAKINAAMLRLDGAEATRGPESGASEPEPERLARAA